MKDKIKCPNCGHSFDVEEAISGKLEAHFRAEYERRVAEQADRFNEEKRKLEEERKQLSALRDNQEAMLKAELAKALENEKARIEKSAGEKYEEHIKALWEENEKRKSENKSLREKEVALMRQEAALKERQEEFELQVERQILEKQREIEEKARAKERESFEMEKVKLLKQIEDNKKLAEEMRRKAEQGSMQLQGEVQELALEDHLSRAYPFDRIQEVPKGMRGADSIQTVVNSLQQECGSIVYESKRTKSFANDWIDKLKQDQMACKADVAVLVTEAMPAGMERFGERDGVWICGFHEVGSVSLVLREMLIRTHSVRKSQENKGDRLELLYSYLTSNEFVQNIRRIVENFDSMMNQLNAEKKAMLKIWKEREKQIWVVHENISALFGSIKGIAGKELEASGVLQLPDARIEESNATDQ